MGVTVLRKHPGAESREPRFNAKSTPLTRGYVRMENNVLAEGRMAERLPQEMLTSLSISAPCQPRRGQYREPMRDMLRGRRGCRDGERGQPGDRIGENGKQIMF